MSRRLVLACSCMLGLVTGCASTAVDLVAVPASEDATIVLSKDGPAKLQLRIMNQGKQPATASPVVVEFYLRNSTATSPPQDGGMLEAGQSSNVLEFEVPDGCVDYGCSFQIKVDPMKQVKESNRSNNNIRGECLGETTSQTQTQTP